MKFLYRLFRKDSNNRDHVVTVTSGLGIVINILIASVKVIVGLAVSSIAVISEGVNNATDAVTSVIAIVGTKLSNKKPDNKHPFGYGRIEYLTSLIIATLILVSGVELLISSVKLIFDPEELSITYVTLIIIGVSGVIKFLVGMLTIKEGRRIGSTSLVAVGTECRNDSFASLITIAASVVFIIFDFSLDAYAGIITSLIIIKAGIGVLRETVAELLGRPGDEELAKHIYSRVRSTEGIVNAADMMLHNYGPDKWSGSVNVEMDTKLSVGQAYAILHDLQLRIMHEDNVTMVFGIYAVDNDNPEARELRKQIAEFVRSHEHVISYHAVYIDRQSQKIYVDLTVDYKLKNWDGLRTEFSEYMNGLYPGRELELTVETDFV